MGIWLGMGWLVQLGSAIDTHHNSMKEVYGYSYFVYEAECVPFYRNAGLFNANYLKYWELVLCNRFGYCFLI